MRFSSAENQKGEFLRSCNIEPLTVPKTPLASKTNGTQKSSLLSLSERWQDVYFVQIGAVLNPVLLDTTYQ